MSKASALLEKLQKANEAILPFDIETVKAAWEAKLAEFPEYTGVVVSNVEVNDDGSAVVSFEDAEGDYVDVSFGSDDDGPYAATESENIETEIDLSPLEPGTITNQFFEYIDLTNLAWVNKSTLSALLGTSNVGPDRSEDTIEEAIGGAAKSTKRPVIRSAKMKHCESLDEAEAMKKVLGGYHLKGTIKVGMTKEVDGTLSKVTGFEDTKGDKPENPMIYQGKKIPGVWLKPTWAVIRKIKTVKKARHRVSGAALAKAARTRSKNAMVKARTQAGMKQAAASAAT